MNFSIKSRYRYLGGFVGARAEMNEWIGEKANEWTAGINDSRNQVAWSSWVVNFLCHNPAR
eukprot:scaffold286181_cov44-Attheya_sp.AAC.1